MGKVMTAILYLKWSYYSKKVFCGFIRIIGLMNQSKWDKQDHRNSSTRNENKIKWKRTTMFRFQWYGSSLIFRIFDLIQCLLDSNSMNFIISIFSHHQTRAPLKFKQIKFSREQGTYCVDQTKHKRSISLSYTTRAQKIDPTQLKRQLLLTFKVKYIAWEIGSLINLNFITLAVPHYGIFNVLF